MPDLPKPPVGIRLADALLKKQREINLQGQTIKRLLEQCRRLQAEADCARGLVTTIDGKEYTLTEVSILAIDAMRDRDLLRGSDDD